jgi:hypothetical protein
VAGLTLDAPAGWIRTTAPTLPGMAFEPALTLTPSKLSRWGLVAATVVDAIGPDLLPAAFTKRLVDAVPKGEPVGLDHVHALRYRRLRVGSALAITLYAVPTASGSVVVACYGPTAKQAGTAHDCEGVVRTLRLSSRAYDLGPDPAYGAKLRPVLGTLDVGRRSWRAKLSSARARTSQATFARALSGVYERAVRGIRGLTISARDREAHGQLARALADARDGYERMSAAASNGRSTRFSGATGDVRRAEAAARGVLASFRGLGYTS